ncbi:MAG: ribosomal small subunit methyltransferase, partial [Gemmatimonadetes bacterium]|nr:ribosomal small subunit methyltransferase [Gemmatimonadota bacterium]
MSFPSRDDAADPYRTWRLYTVTVSGRSYELATKPGVFSHGRLEPAALLLATQMNVAAGDVAVHLNCGSGLAGTVASLSGGASRVLLTDRNVLSVEAARRTLAANGVRDAEVQLGHGAQSL